MERRGKKNLKKGGEDSKESSSKLNPAQKLTRGTLRKYFDTSDRTPEDTSMAEATGLDPNENKTRDETIMAEAITSVETKQDIKDIQKTLSIILEKLAPVEKLNKSLTMLTTRMDEIKGDVEDNKKGVERVEKGLSKNANNLEDLKQSLQYSQKDITDLQTRMDTVTQQQSMDRHGGIDRLMKRKIQNLEAKVIDLESYSRRENLIFYGVNEQGEREDLMDTIYRILEQKLQMLDARSRIKLVRVHRLGKKREIMFKWPRPIIVKFHYYPDADEVYKKRKLMWDKSGTPLRVESNVSCSGIGLDFPETVKQKRNYLKQVLKLAKVKDPRAFLQRDRLVYMTKPYTLHECYKIPDLNVFELGTIEKECHILFYGRFSPYSNFYPANMDIEGKTYNCVEQFYQYRKAVYLNKEQVALDIMLADDPLEIKHLGNTLESLLWTEEHALAAMFQGVSNKFEQNSRLNKMLKETGDKKIVECNLHDSFWGNGTTLKDPRSLQDIGQNMLGITLMKVREQL